MRHLLSIILLGILLNSCGEIKEPQKHIICIKGTNGTFTPAFVTYKYHVNVSRLIKFIDIQSKTEYTLHISNIIIIMKPKQED